MRSIGGGGYTETTVSLLHGILFILSKFILHHYDITNLIKGTITCSIQPFLGCERRKYQRIIINLVRFTNSRSIYQYSINPITANRNSLATQVTFVILELV